MRVSYRIGLNAGAFERAAWARIGFEIPEGLFVFHVDEDDPRCPDARALAQELRHVCLVETKFTNRELAQAAYLVPGATGHTLYPQPEDDFGYMDATYDVTNYCKKCGVGAVQNAPFRLRGAPKWGSKGIIQLHWVFDQFFTTSEVYETVFAPFGIGSMPVLQNRSGRVIEDMVQLIIEPLVDIDTAGLDGATCPYCNKGKFAHKMGGPQPKPLGMTGHAARTRPWFGSGANGVREIIFSQAIRQAAQQAKLKGVQFTPCAK